MRRFFIPSESATIYRAFIVIMVHEPTIYPSHRARDRISSTFIFHATCKAWSDVRDFGCVLQIRWDRRLPSRSSHRCWARAWTRFQAHPLTAPAPPYPTRTTWTGGCNHAATRSRCNSRRCHRDTACIERWKECGRSSALPRITSESIWMMCTRYTRR